MARLDCGEDAARLLVHRFDVEPPHVGCCSERRVERDDRYRRGGRRRGEGELIRRRHVLAA